MEEYIGQNLPQTKSPVPYLTGWTKSSTLVQRALTKSPKSFKKDGNKF